jgi:hypothetical protein
MEKAAYAARNLPQAPQNLQAQKKGRKWKDCECSVWLAGNYGGEKIKRHSLNLNDWERAEQIKQAKREGKTTEQASVRDF